ncbi:MAG: hypothetical protein WBA42_01375 [Mesorhizobium sp.]
MTRLFVGNKAGTGPVLKMMRNDGDDPLTTAITDFGKFLFDSETTKLGYVYDIEDIRLDRTKYPIGSPNAYYYTPSGSGSSNCAIQVSARGADQINNYYLQNYSSYFGYLPIVEFRHAVLTDQNTFTGPSLDFSAFVVSGSWLAMARAGYLCQTMNVPIVGGTGSREAYSETFYDPSVGTAAAHYRSVMSTIELPLRNDAIPNYAATPVSGQNPILISPSVARIALPGRVVTDTDVRRFIAHENRIPAKIMKAGDINVAAGSTATINTPLPLTPLTYMDFHAKLQSASEFFHPPFFDQSSAGDDINFSYTVNSQSVTLRNTGAKAITVRYVIFADSDQANTTGGSAVLRKANDGTQDYLQMKRPGSSDSAPNLNDIIIDSRMAYFPLVKEGFLNWSSDFPNASSNLVWGERYATVNFANPSGFKPFVKCAVIFPSPSVYTFTAIGGLRQVFINAGSDWSNRCTCISSLARIKAAGTSVDFYMSGDNPLYKNTGTADPIYNGTALGLRYYIFAIPASL